ncbi:MAG: fatty acid--CoA ligase [Gammaproteobacteria bacterium]|nr:fatty acid--CoA ligase [Gammaproteobacteria bacterium]
MKATRASSAYAYPLLIRQLWHTPMSCNPNQEIVSGAERRFSYRELHERVHQLAAGLSSIGVRAGDTVAVMDWDNHRYLECFFAVPMMAAVLHTINLRLSPEQILYTINHAEDDVILLHADFVPIIEQIRARIETDARFVFLRDAPDIPVPGFCEHEYEALLQSGDAEFEFGDFDENTVATTFYTTGTTGDPKAVFYSHRQLVLHTLGLVGGLASADSSSRVHRGDVYMPITPMFHVHAWGFPYAATLLGIKQVYPGRYDPAQLLRMIETEGVTFSHCVPTILHMLLAAPEAGQVDLRGWKVVIGGAALPLGLAQLATQRGIDLFAAYGMSETCPFLTAAELSGVYDVDSEGDLAARCKTGKPTLMVDLRVVDFDMNDIPRGGAVTGEVVVRSPWLTQGYAGNPEGSEALWEGGYLHTGDVGYIDAGGSLQITDRIKDVIKSGGEWISSLQLENLVSACAGVNEVAAIGIADKRWGERPMLAIVGNTGADADAIASEVRAAIQAGIDAGQVSKWAMPERIEMLEALPKTSVGKMDKKLLRARYAETG